MITERAEIGDTFENIADHPGRMVRVVEILPDGFPDSPGFVAAHVEVLAAPQNLIARYGAGTFQYTTASALLNEKRFRRLSVKGRSE